MLLVTYHALNYAGIIGLGLPANKVIIPSYKLISSENQLISADNKDCFISCGNNYYVGIQRLNIFLLRHEAPYSIYSTLR